MCCSQPLVFVFQSFLRCQGVKLVMCSPCSCLRLRHMGMFFMPPWVSRSSSTPKHRLPTAGMYFTHVLTNHTCQIKIIGSSSSCSVPICPAASMTSRSAALRTWAKRSRTTHTEKPRSPCSGRPSTATCTDLSRSASPQRPRKRQCFLVNVILYNSLFIVSWIWIIFSFLCLSASQRWGVLLSWWPNHLSLKVGSSPVWIIILKTRNDWKQWMNSNVRSFYTIKSSYQKLHVWALLWFSLIYLDRPLVSGCSIVHKPLLLHGSRWDMDQTHPEKKSK